MKLQFIFLRFQKIKGTRMEAKIHGGFEAELTVRFRRLKAESDEKRRNRTSARV